MSHTYRERLRQRQDQPAGGGIQPTFVPATGVVSMRQQQVIAERQKAAPPVVPPVPPEEIRPEAAGALPPITVHQAPGVPAGEPVPMYVPGPPAAETVVELEHVPQAQGVEHDHE